MPAALPPERQTQNSPTASTIGLFDWCRHQESNSGPPDYKSGALPTELYRLTEIPCGTSAINWCRHQESNSGPPDYKSGALPTELYRLTEIPCGTSAINWCRHQESNSGPPDYKSGALPTELYRQRRRIIPLTAPLGKSLSPTK